MKTIFDPPKQEQRATQYRGLINEFVIMDIKEVKKFRFWGYLGEITVDFKLEEFNIVALGDVSGICSTRQWVWKESIRIELSSSRRNMMGMEMIRHTIWVRFYL